jgi:hypothetical protein
MSRLADARSKSSSAQFPLLRERNRGAPPQPHNKPGLATSPSRFVTASANVRLNRLVAESGRNATANLRDSGTEAVEQSVRERVPRARQSGSPSLALLDDLMGREAFKGGIEVLVASIETRRRHARAKLRGRYPGELNLARLTGKA